MIKFGENFSPGSLLNQTQTYQGNPYGVYPDLSSFAGSGIIQNSLTCIKWSAPSKVHIIRYQSFDSWYRFYPIQFFFFVICLGFVFCSCSVICVLLCSSLCSCYVLVLALFLVSFRFCVKKNIMFEFCYKFSLGTIWLRGLGFSTLLNLFSYLPIERIS